MSAPTDQELRDLAQAVHPTARRIVVRVYPVPGAPRGLGWRAGYRATCQYLTTGSDFPGATEDAARERLAAELRAKAKS